MHYNDGWDNGYRYNIIYWEIWNEPDLSGFWNGTAEQYYELYEKTAKTLKEYNSSLKIGGPCTSSIYNANFTTAFLDYVSVHNIPLDFFSWHMYTENPDELYEASLSVRKMLDDHGFTECENINTEWNINILLPQRDNDNAKNAAFTASVLTLLQDAGIDYVFRYRGTQDDNWLMKILGFDLSLFTAANVSAGITCLAGISDDRTNISVLISNYDGPDTECDIAVDNLPWDSYRAVHYLIDEKHHLEVVEDNELASSAYNTTELIEKNSVHFIRFTNSTVIPNEGPNVASIPLLLRLPFLDPIFRIIGLILLSIIFG